MTASLACESDASRGQEVVVRRRARGLGALLRWDAGGIGPVGVDGGDTFNFEVCTPSALASRLDADGRPYWARGTLIVRSFAPESVEAALNQYVRSVDGDDSAELATKLNRFMRWEFEDY